MTAVRRWRRGWPVGLVTVLVVALLLVGGGPLPLARAAAANPIMVENLQPGSSQWQIPNSNGTQVADDTNNQIKGYASQASVPKGRSITFAVSVNPAQTFTLDIFRMGYYQGLGGRLMQHVNALNGIQQPACPVIDATTYLVPVAGRRAMR